MKEIYRTFIFNYIPIEKAVFEVSLEKAKKELLYFQPWFVWVQA